MASTHTWHPWRLDLYFPETCPPNKRVSKREASNGKARTEKYAQRKLRRTLMDKRDARTRTRISSHMHPHITTHAHAHPTHPRAQSVSCSRLPLPSRTAAGDRSSGERTDYSSYTGGNLAFGTPRSGNKELGNERCKCRAEKRLQLANSTGASPSYLTTSVHAGDMLDRSTKRDNPLVSFGFTLCDQLIVSLFGSSEGESESLGTNALS